MKKPEDIRLWFWCRYIHKPFIMCIRPLKYTIANKNKQTNKQKEQTKNKQIADKSLDR